MTIQVTYTVALWVTPKCNRDRKIQIFVPLLLKLLNPVFNAYGVVFVEILNSYVLGSTANLSLRSVLSPSGYSRSQWRDTAGLTSRTIHVSLGFVSLYKYVASHSDSDAGAVHWITSGNGSLGETEKTIHRSRHHVISVCAKKGNSAQKVLQILEKKLKRQHSLVH